MFLKHRFVGDNMENKFFIVSLKKSVLVTYLGVVFGVMAMWCAFTKMAFADVEYIRYSLILLMFAGICDMFDGKVARKCKRSDIEKEFGIQIDSLADTINFLAVPVVIMLSLGMTEWYEVLVYVLFVLCGISRLAVFNCNANPNGPVEHFTGLPVTTTAIIYPLLGLLRAYVTSAVFNNIYLIATLITSILFITKMKVPKLKKKIYFIIFPILAAVVTTLLLVVR